jgi:hypothetical protein
MSSREPKITYVETKERPSLGSEKDDAALKSERISNPTSRCRCGFVHPNITYTSMKLARDARARQGEIY